MTHHNIFKRTATTQIPAPLRWVCNAVILAALFIVLGGSLAAQVKKIRIDDGVISKIDLSDGSTVTVETDQPFADILIGNTDVLDVFPLTGSSLYLQGKRSGSTNVTLYSDEKRLLEVIEVRVRIDYSDLSKALRSAVPSAQVNVTNINDRIRLSGVVKDNRDLGRVLEIASQYAPADTQVINAIRVASPQQVELDVRIIEVSRNAGRELGVNLDGSKPKGGSSGFTTGGTPNRTPFGVAVGQLLEISGFQVDFLINALETKGLARRLANPKLVTTSGEKANFVVGGEVPIQEVNRDALNPDALVVETETSFREFGVRLEFLATVLDDDLIRLEITPEVSDIDPSITVNGVPGFTTRRAETTVSLRSGQSFAIAGLLQANNARSAQQMPWLGNVPVLGALFKSSDFQKRETDLVILVTPRLVRPTKPGEPLATPLDGTKSSNDVELFLLGMLEVDRKLLRKFEHGEGVIGPFGHIIDLDFEDGVIVKK